MRRLFSAILIGMFAVGFCAGCGEDTKSSDADTSSSAADSGGAEGGSDAE